MKNHKWSKQDCALLEENVKEYGLTLGCKKTASALYLTERSCIEKHYNLRRKFEKSRIKVDHPEIAKKAKVVEEKKTRKCIPWREEEIELLKMNLKKYGFTKGCARTSIAIDRTVNACRVKTAMVLAEGFDHGHKRKVNLSKVEDELVRFFEKRISENPNNLQAVFREGAEKFNVTPKTLEQRWYGYMKQYSDKPTCRKNMKPVFTVIGANATINGKNQECPDIVQTKGLFRIIKDWFKNIFKV